MRNTAILTLMLAHAAATAADCPPVADRGVAVDAVKRLEYDGARYNVDGWTIDDARGFFTADYFSAQPDGRLRRLDAVLATFVDGRSPGWARRFDVTNLEVRVYHCTSAVATGIIEALALAAPADARPWRLRYLNVWRLEDGHWRNAANQFARIAEPPPKP